ncbi:MAG TPA: hypothetical protein PKW14_06370 [Bacteroidota bacterium]|nr:hypothetical protein [Bacteroidota bacterium]
MTLVKAFRIFGYFVSIVLFVFGLVLVTGFINYGRLKYVPDKFRITFGVVFILYGIYRFVRLYYTRDYDKNDENDE